METNSRSIFLVVLSNSNVFERLECSLYFFGDVVFVCLSSLFEGGYTWQPLIFLGFERNLRAAVSLWSVGPFTRWSSGSASVARS